ncbi:carboxypeptidase-like regulatory domain-containing protein [Cellulophaga sp. HaHaR_3_176]|uniref:carboxypeptidase-like regulatory domain-containing protein n=1 Tax=Cellulophaga sp. HaHaR_3_176 TaxID=1942464 RepID=UPI001C1FF76F|nr:carboxypeptidase-like regulatory domain-containing protein [Cellulophaga sp. HaHaR_3_176]QWX84295.1 carboxypeptidase-like regulatory domain-containing protein [Cellulophaga sp. HaHaR_3_176]
MKKKLLLILTVFSVFFGFSQDDEDGRALLRGKVLYRNSSVQNENVINVTTEKGVITNKQGEYAINVKLGDELVFMALNYQIERVFITQDILDNNRLVVEVNEKVTELDEVVVGPENQEAFLKLKNEEFKQYTYEIDRTTEVENVALSEAERGMQNGLNLKNIYKAIAKGLKGENGEVVEQKKMKVSDVLRQVYDDSFFVNDLQLPQDKINAFLYYCDSRLPEQSLLKKTNEFELIDFLVTQSKEFKKSINEDE